MNFTFKALTFFQRSATRKIHLQPLILKFNSTSVTCNIYKNSCQKCFRSRLSTTSSNLKGNETIVKGDSDKSKIYYGPLATQIRMVKFFSLSTSAISIGLQPILFNSISQTPSVALMIGAFSFIGFFTIGTPLLLHYITKKYVVTIDYKPKTNSYVARTFTILGRPKELEFKVEDVYVPEVPGMFTTFIAKNVPLFVDARHFDNPDHYGKIMGYDKPIDLKLYQTSHNKEDDDTK